MGDTTEHLPDDLSVENQPGSVNVVEGGQRCHSSQMMETLAELKLAISQRAAASGAASGAMSGAASGVANTQFHTAGTEYQLTVGREESQPLSVYWSWHSPRKVGHR